MRYIHLFLALMIIILFYCMFTEPIDPGKSPEEELATIQVQYNTRGKKPYLWTYWDTLPGKQKPELMKLCRETLDRNCSQSFNVMHLDKDSIKRYLPELESIPILHKLKEHRIGHKTDVYRIMLLYKYGGMYLDTDIIVLRDLDQIIDKLNRYDYVGFGCTGVKCNGTSRRPSSWAMAARPGSIFMERVLLKLLYIFRDDKFKNDESTDQLAGSENGYHSISKLLYWQVIEELRKEQNYEYYHYDDVDGSRDENMLWVTNERIFSSKPINYRNEGNLMFVVFYNNLVPDNIRNLDRDTLLNTNSNLTRYIRKGLGMEPYKGNRQIAMHGQLSM